MEVALASGLLKVAGDRLGSLIISEFAAMMSVKKEISELQDIHGEITSWLSALRDQSIESDPQFRWVIKLKDVAYDIDDLLFEVQIEAEKHKILESDGGKPAITGCFCAQVMLFLFRCKVAGKIQAVKVTFAEIVRQRSDANILLTSLRLDHNLPAPVVELSLLSNVEESKIPTRDKEKGEIISRLLDSNEGKDDWIVSIVGLGGSGKTTLAKHICRDNMIKEHFKEQIFWIHVSQEFDMEKLICKLFEAIIDQKSNLHTPQHMLGEVTKKLDGMKFLLVLDDAWNEDQHDWEQFMVHLKSGGPGSKILVTTRSKNVAEIVKSRHIFELAFLSEAESWSLFLYSCGWAEEDLGSEYIQVGKEILKRCGGVPLAIKIIGGILSQKRELSSWRAIRQSDLWNVKNINDRVFTSLKLSYIHLADELKQCFTFCSLFPKGLEIYKDRLIAQWVAHGFISGMDGVSPEDIGSDYFDSLVKVGFLHDLSEIRDTKQLVCKMHDLIHDLTRHILQNEVVISVSNNMTATYAQRCRYLSLTSCTEKVDRSLFQKVRAVYMSESKTSLDKLVKRSCCMRSIVLDYEIGTPVPILKFEYLGYLEIHNGIFIKFPEAISGCWNLKSLIFIGCSGFVTLPESIGKLKKLRTLELNHITDLESLPQAVGDCKDLQSLQLYSCWMLRTIPSSIGRIGRLRKLCMVRCDSLEELPSEFSGGFTSLETLNLAKCGQLQYLPRTLACHMLSTLDLSRTKVTMLPHWVTTIGTLEYIELQNCSNLLELPKGIGKLNRLEVLNVVGCSKLRCMPSGFGELTRLRQLGLFVIGSSGDDARISELENLDMISGEMQITNLMHLKDPSDAEKACLKRKKNIHNLVLDWSLSETEEELVLGMEKDQVVLSALEPPPQIKHLKICGYRGTCLPCWLIKQNHSCYLEGILLKQTCRSQFISLRELTLEEFPNLKHMRELLELPSLKFLKLLNMANLEELWTTTNGWEIRREELSQHCFPVLSYLSIWGCPKLTVKPCFPPSLEELSLEESNQQLLSPGNFSRRLPPIVAESSSSSYSVHSGVPRLRALHVAGMEGSSSGWDFLWYLTALETLSIYGCNNLTRLPEDEILQNLTCLQSVHVEQ